MLKTLGRIAAVIVVLLLVAVGVLLYSMDGLARRGIEHAGTHVLGTPTTVAGVRIGVVNPSASLRLLAVENPPAFAGRSGDGAFLRLGSGSLALDVWSLLGETVRIPSIHLSDLTLSLIQKGAESNASTILASMRRALGAGGGDTSGGGSAGRRFVIDELLIERISVDASVTGLPVPGPAVTLKVERVRLESIGSGGRDPVGLDQLTALVVSAVMQAVVEAGASQLPRELLEGVLGGVAGLGSGVPDFSLSLDTGGGFRPVGDLASLAARAGVDLDSLRARIADPLGRGLGDVGRTVEDAGRRATEGIQKGLEGLLK